MLGKCSMDRCTAMAHQYSTNKAIISANLKTVVFQEKAFILILIYKWMEFYITIKPIIKSQMVNTNIFYQIQISLALKLIFKTSSFKFRRKINKLQYLQLKQHYYDRQLYDGQFLNYKDCQHTVLVSAHYIYVGSVKDLQMHGVGTLVFNLNAQQRKFKINGEKKLTCTIVNKDEKKPANIK
ncbi:Hypothetical_protein [Hexamita inflata]|uniref:Hypothetical_protein n=1 Tax=Hexamita inflata TaxID=28002 RepID=A0AA86V4X3_9EUKA|nr:Hypothetical protein HINF_LOCUS64246 [Hexamita inflata]